MTINARHIDEVVYSESLSDTERLKVLTTLAVELEGTPLHPYALSSVAHVAFTYLNDTHEGFSAIGTLAKLYSNRDVVAEVALSLEGMLSVTNPSARDQLVKVIEPYMAQFRDDYRQMWIERTK